MFLALLGAIVLAGCGGNGDTTSQTTYNNGSGNQPFKPTTHLSHRSLVTNYYAGQLQVMDATQDRLTNFTFATGAQSTYMQPSPDGTLTFVNNSGGNSISSFNNNQEAVKASIFLSGFTESFVTSVNNKVGFAAVYNYNNGTFRTPGAIVRFNPTDGSLNTQIMFPKARYLAMDPLEKHLLVFNDSDNIAYWVDLNTIDSTLQVPPYYPITIAAHLSRPVAAFFSADSTKAYILNCGIECGGTDVPSVIEISVPASPASPVTGTAVTSTVVKSWPVNGARRGLMDLKANKLYVVGSTSTVSDSAGNAVQDGYFTTIDLAAGTASAPIRIGNGAKYVIRNVNGAFWVGSTHCGVQSCFTIVNAAAGTATVLPTSKGDGTGVSFTANSGEVYTIEGGEFYMYDQSGNPITSQYATDVRGQASDVLYIN